MKLTPEDLKKLQARQVANIIQKLNSGKTLTAREEAILAQARTAEEIGTPGEGTGGYATTWEALAKALGVSRRSIQEWRKDPRYADTCPMDRADGRKDIAAWSRFMLTHGLKRADEHVASNPNAETNPGAQPPTATAFMRPPQFNGTAADWRKAEIARRVERQEIELAKVRRELLGATEVEILVGRTASAIRAAFLQLPGRAAQDLVGRDIHEIEERLTDEVHNIFTRLHACGYLENAYDEQLAADLTADQEGTRLLGLLDYANQDQATSRKILLSLLQRIMQLIGRRALANSGIQTSDPNSRPDSPVLAAVRTSE